MNDAQRPCGRYGPPAWVATVGLMALLLTHSSAQADALSHGLERVDDAIEALRLEEARALLSGLSANLGGAEPPGVTFYDGALAFYEGRYAEALALIDRALRGVTEASERRRWASMRELVSSTLEVTRGLESQASADGRFVVWFTPGADAVLADYALEVLERADQALTKALGTRVPGPVRLEIFPSAHALAAVSALTVQQIETTGTIALSKWNRLMVTSPRALVRGYPWADTITHEFVHMVLSRVTHERAPVWLQEGTAKLLERSWRERERELRLDPSAEALLTAAREKGELLTFEEMHPSIAMLPSQEAAALAFAEVATFMDRYVARHGYPTLQAALAAIAAGDDARDALEKAAKTPFASLEKAWRSSLSTAGGAAEKREPTPAPRRLARRLRSGTAKPDETQEVDARARRFLRLGDLLWDRGHTLGAKVEYQKAHEAAPDDPIVGSRLARTALAVGDAAAAKAAIAPLVKRYPDHAPGHAVLGAAELKLGHRELAARALRESIFINPFDPSPHCNLAKATDDAAERERETRACATLKGS